jgi:hypothetical protein
MNTWFKKIFKRKKVNLNIVKQAIFDYRNEGKKLMDELGKKYNLDINNHENYIQLISQSNDNIPRKGELSKNWYYSFHGGECGFYNKKSKQSIEVVLSNPPKFGHIDAWFLMNYMQSTEKYKNEIKGIEWTDLKPLIDKLYNTEEVIFIGK